MQKKTNNKLFTQDSKSFKIMQNGILYIYLLSSTDFMNIKINIIWFFISFRVIYSLFLLYILIFKASRSYFVWFKMFYNLFFFNNKNFNYNCFYQFVIFQRSGHN